MDYELMMNGNVKIGQRAPEFEATTTMGKVSLNDYSRKMVNFIFTSRRFYTRMYNRNDCIHKSSYIFFSIKYWTTRTKCRQ